MGLRPLWLLLDCLGVLWGLLRRRRGELSHGYGLPRNVLRERLTNEVERRMDLEALERTKAAEQADRLRLDELLG